ARSRTAPTSPPRPGAPRPVAHAHDRGGALASLAAWAVRRGGPRGRGAATTGSAPFDRLGAPVLAQAPSRAAPRVCGRGDTGSRHRGAAAGPRRQQRAPPRLL